MRRVSATWEAHQAEEGHDNFIAPLHGPQTWIDDLLEEDEDLVVPPSLRETRERVVDLAAYRELRKHRTRS